MSMSEMYKHWQGEQVMIQLRNPTLIIGSKGPVHRTSQTPDGPQPEPLAVGVLAGVLDVVTSGDDVHYEITMPDPHGEPRATVVALVPPHELVSMQRVVKPRLVT